MTVTCPNGHQSQADDYCDVCGSPIDPSAQPGAAASSVPGTTGSYAAEPAAAPTPGAAAAGSTGDSAAAAEPESLECPNCAAHNPPGALFCEACGYDFTTGRQTSSYVTADVVRKTGSHLAAVAASSRSKMISGIVLLLLGLGTSIAIFVLSPEGERRVGIALLPTIFGIIWIVRGITERNIAREADVQLARAIELLHGAKSPGELVRLTQR